MVGTSLFIKINYRIIEGKFCTSRTPSSKKANIPFLFPIPPETTGASTKIVYSSNR